MIIDGIEYINKSGIKQLDVRENFYKGEEAQEEKAIEIMRDLAKEDATLLTITENGYGKRTAISEYRLIKRGGKGVINILTKHIKPSSKNNNVIGIKTVTDNDEILLISAPLME